MAVDVHSRAPADFFRPPTDFTGLQFQTEKVPEILGAHPGIPVEITVQYDRCAVMGLIRFRCPYLNDRPAVTAEERAADIIPGTDEDPIFVDHRSIDIDSVFNLPGGPP